MTPHLLRYQGLAVDDYGFTLDVSNLWHPRLSLNKSVNLIIVTCPVNCNLKFHLDGIGISFFWVPL